jgi:hypothetical protein
MFNIYQHGKKSDYRLIIPEGSSLPSEAKKENRKLTKAADIICTSPLQLSAKSKADSRPQVSRKSDDEFAITLFSS